MKTKTALAGLALTGALVVGCAADPAPTQPIDTATADAPTPVESEPAVAGTVDTPLAFGEPAKITDLGEDAADVWEVTVTAPADKTAEVIAFHDGVTGFEDEYPADYVHQVVNVTITRLGEVPASPGDELSFALTVDGIEEQLGPVTFTDGPRFAFLDPMQAGATIDYPLVFTVPPGKVGTVVVTGPSGPTYFG